jgi:hypothetical protein
VTEATDDVVVNHPGGLHVRVTDGRADKLEAARLQIFAHGVRVFGARWDLLAGFPVVDLGRAIGELPYIFVEAAELFLRFEKSFGVLDGGGDFQAIANDAGVVEKFGDFRFAVARDLLRIELIERFAKVFALLQNAIPAQASLHSLQYEKFEQFAIVMERHAPLGVVITNVKIVRGPGAAWDDGVQGSVFKVQRLCGPHRRDKVADLLMVLFAGSRFDAAGDVDTEGFGLLDGGGDVFWR